MASMAGAGLGEKSQQDPQKTFTEQPKFIKKVIRKKFEKQYTIEARQWFRQDINSQIKKIRCHLKKVLKGKREEQMKL